MVRKFASVASLLAVALLAGSPARASSSSGFGRIVGLSSTSTGAILFSLEAISFDSQFRVRRAGLPRDAVPACAVAQPNRWAIDASTVPGQVAAQTLLWAVDHGKSISITGSGKCSIWADAETVSVISIQDTN